MNNTHYLLRTQIDPGQTVIVAAGSLEWCKESALTARALDSSIFEEYEIVKRLEKGEKSR